MLVCRAVRCSVAVLDRPLAWVAELQEANGPGALVGYMLILTLVPSLISVSTVNRPLTGLDRRIVAGFGVFLLAAQSGIHVSV